ncbi:MAG TPA: hypothetical protein VHS96_07090, partial [Bacteroidia bacterium]|nr:hypothetical protein [Bacteroidia bacterium]
PKSKNKQANEYGGRIMVFFIWKIDAGHGKMVGMGGKNGVQGQVAAFVGTKPWRSSTSTKTMDDCLELQ